MNNLIKLESRAGYNYIYYEQQSRVPIGGNQQPPLVLDSFFCPYDVNLLRNQTGGGSVKYTPPPCIKTQPVLDNNSYRRGCSELWLPIQDMPRELLESVTEQGSKLCNVLVQSAMEGSDRFIMTNHQTENILCLSSLMRSSQSLRLNSSVIQAKKQPPRTGIICKLHIIFATLGRGTD